MNLKIKFMKNIIRKITFPIFNWWFDSMLYEICRSGQSVSYRWFRFRELIHLPSYAMEDKKANQKLAMLFVINKTFPL